MHVTLSITSDYMGDANEPGYKSYLSGDILTLIFTMANDDPSMNHSLRLVRKSFRTFGDWKSICQAMPEHMRMADWVLPASESVTPKYWERARRSKTNQNQHMKLDQWEWHMRARALMERRRGQLREFITDKPMLAASIRLQAALKGRFFYCDGNARFYDNFDIKGSVQELRKLDLTNAAANPERVEQWLPRYAPTTLLDDKVNTLNLDTNVAYAQNPTKRTVVWWTPDGRVWADRNCRLMSLHNHFNYVSNFVEGNPASNQFACHTGRIEKFDASIFWNLSLVYLHYKSVGSPHRTAMMRELATYRDRSGHLKYCTYCGQRQLQQQQWMEEPQVIKLIQCSCKTTWYCTKAHQLADTEHKDNCNRVKTGKLPFAGPSTTQQAQEQQVDTPTRKVPRPSHRWAQCAQCEMPPDSNFSDMNAFYQHVDGATHAEIVTAKREFCHTCRKWYRLEVPGHLNRDALKLHLRDCPTNTLSIDAAQRRKDIERDIRECEEAGLIISKQAQYGSSSSSSSANGS